MKLIYIQASYTALPGAVRVYLLGLYGQAGTPVTPVGGPVKERPRRDVVPAETGAGLVVEHL